MDTAKAALIWITDILKKLNVPFQITGGLAARAYGATRPLVDIDVDIPEEAFNRVKKEVVEFIVFGPERYKDAHWDLLLITVDYKGQAIDLAGAYTAKMFNKQTGDWLSIITNFSTVQVRNVLGIEMPVIAINELLAYKKIIRRDVDLIDIQELYTPKLTGLKK